MIWKCYAYSIAILNSIFLKQLLFIENSQWSSCWVLLRNFFLHLECVNEMFLRMYLRTNCFAKQKHTVSKSVIIGKPANLLIDCEYIDWMRHLLIMNALFSLSGKLILFFSLSNHVEHSNWVNWDEIISHSNIYEPSSIHIHLFSVHPPHTSIFNNIHALLSLLSELMCSFHRLCEPNKGFIF